MSSLINRAAPLTVVALMLAATSCATGTGRPRVDGDVEENDAGRTTDGGDAGVEQCVNECAPGASQCTPDSRIQACEVAPNGCTRWAEAEACPGTQTCSGGQCTDRCTDQCAEGQNRCASGSQIQPCARHSNGCLEWSTARSCGAMSACNGGACSDTCQNNCAPGERRCAGDGSYQECQLGSNGCYDYGAARACVGTQTCSGGMCQETCTNQCGTEGARRCANGTSYQSCERQTNGCLDWNAQVSCPSSQGCTDGQCALSCVNQCTRDTRRCAGTSGYQICAIQASGCTDWSPASACAADQVCTGDGICQTCTNGERRCGAGNNVEECASGTWVSVAGCPFGCSMGACTAVVTCTAGRYRCNGNVIEVCNSSGTAYLALQSCAVGCVDGGCTGACTPGDKRCAGAFIETCNAAGTAWDRAPTACTVCDNGACLPDMLSIATSQDADGTIAVAGPFVLRSGATLRANSGNLTIRATSITIEAGASIQIAPTGNGAGAGGTGASACDTGRVSGGGGGTNPTRDTDSEVFHGGPGGRGGAYTCSGSHVGGGGGLGGGVLRLFADTIVIGGTISADGTAGRAGSGSYGAGGGGGAGGGVLIAGDQVTLQATSAISAVGGGPGSGWRAGNAGLPGRIKILHGSLISVMGLQSGMVIRAQLPPLRVTSSTHPNPDRIYNDDFDLVAISYDRAYPTRQGYYWLFNRVEHQVPGPAVAGAMFTASETVSVPRDGVAAGINYFHVAPVNPTSEVGTVKTTFRVQVNALPPNVSSSSHPNGNTWSDNPNVFYQWTPPTDDVNLRGYWYVLDQFGETMPRATDTFLPITQRQLLRSNLPSGIWVFHLVSVDTMGRPTRVARHYPVRIGPDPGNGTLLGRVITPAGAGIVGARISVNRALFTGTTVANGSYNLMTVPVGMYEVTASAMGFQPQTRTVSITTGGTTTQDFMLSPM